MFGPGASQETGFHLSRLGVRRALLVSDRACSDARHHRACRRRDRGARDRDRRLRAQRGSSRARHRVERRSRRARDGGFDGFVGVGGGSSIDTAKIARSPRDARRRAPRLRQPADRQRARRPPGPLLPVVAVPTTAGTGSEATAVAIARLPRARREDGHLAPHLRPRVGIVDPRLTLTALPPAVTASCGLDVALPRRSSPTPPRLRSRARARRRPGRAAAVPGREPGLGRLERAGDRTRRPSTCAAPSRTAPTSRRARDDDAGGDDRRQSASAAPACTSHTPARIRSRRSSTTGQPPGYPDADAFVPHGFSVDVTAPAAFRFTEHALPERHRRAAELLTGEPVDAGRPRCAAARLRAAHARTPARPPACARSATARPTCPTSWRAPLKQQRLLVCTPRTVAEADLEAILRASL